MYTPKFFILGRKADGSVLELFLWCHGATAGIERAKRDAKRFGMTFTKIWAEAL